MCRRTRRRCGWGMYWMTGFGRCIRMWRRRWRSGCWSVWRHAMCLQFRSRLLVPGRSFGWWGIVRHGCGMRPDRWCWVSSRWAPRSRPGRPSRWRSCCVSCEERWFASGCLAQGRFRASARCAACSSLDSRTNASAESHGARKSSRSNQRWGWRGLVGS